MVVCYFYMPHANTSSQIYSNTSQGCVKFKYFIPGLLGHPGVLIQDTDLQDNQFVNSQRLCIFFLYFGEVWNMRFLFVGELGFCLVNIFFSFPLFCLGPQLQIVKKFFGLYFSDPRLYFLPLPGLQDTSNQNSDLFFTVPIQGQCCSTSTYSHTLLEILLSLTH